MAAIKKEKYGNLQLEKFQRGILCPHGDNATKQSVRTDVLFQYEKTQVNTWYYIHMI